MKSPPNRSGRPGGRAHQQSAAPQRGSLGNVHVTGPDTADARHEIERRAAAICRNTEGALLHDFPIDNLLLSNLTLADRIALRAQVLL